MDEIRSEIAGLSPDELVAAAAAMWRLERRAEQCAPPGDWDIWLIMSGRGFGKTRVGAEEVRERVNSGRAKRINLVARTAADARDTMVEGESGILACCKYDAGNIPVYEPSKRQVSWPNGAIAKMFSAEQPDALRGPQCDFWWADELASWQYLDETWSNLMFGARLGEHVQGVVTTTPRPVPLIKQLVEQSRGDKARVVVTRGSTMDNAANLAPNALASLKARYEGTRLGRQELNGEILDDNPGALWQRSDLDKYRVSAHPRLALVCVGVDPAVSSGGEACETGIVVCGRDEQSPPHYYVLDDLSLSGATPDQWGRQAVAAYNKWRADSIVAERNNGGEMVEATIKTVSHNLPVKSVWASRGKRTRAEPVSALSEQGRLHFVGSLAALEDQLCEWDPSPEAKMDSPDRLDAMVWAVSEMLERPEGRRAPGTAPDYDMGALT